MSIIPTSTISPDHTTNYLVREAFHETKRAQDQSQEMSKQNRALQNLVNSLKEKNDKNKEQMERGRQLIQSVHGQIDPISNKNKIIGGQAVTIGYDVIKILTKVGCVLSKTAVATRLATVAPKLAKVSLKYIPIIGLAVGIIAAFGRGIEAYRTDNLRSKKVWLQITGEVVSGILCTVPGWGTAVSIGIDVLNTAIDCHGIYYNIKERDKMENDMKSNAKLGELLLEEMPNRRKKNQALLQTHPDKAGALSAYHQSQFEDITKFVNQTSSE